VNNLNGLPIQKAECCSQDLVAPHDIVEAFTQRREIERTGNLTNLGECVKRAVLGRLTIGPDCFLGERHRKRCVARRPHQLWSVFRLSLRNYLAHPIATIGPTLFASALKKLGTFEE
jgi:hypothetical protein